MLVAQDWDKTVPVTSAQQTPGDLRETIFKRIGFMLMRVDFDLAMACLAQNPVQAFTGGRPSTPTQSRINSIDANSALTPLRDVLKLGVQKIQKKANPARHVVSARVDREDVQTDRLIGW